MSEIIFKTIGSVEKILKYERPKADEKSNLCFKNGRHNFQLAIWSSDRIRECKVEVSGTLAPYVTLRIVEDVAVKFTYNYDILFDDDYALGKKAGMYPDVLRPYECYDLTVFPEQWTSIWVTITGKTELPVGKHTLSFVLKSEEGELAKTEYLLEIVDESLPPLDIFNINWIHYDCICEWYGLEPFTDAFYEMTNKYLTSAVEHGVNTLFVPLFTPPLDTQIGSERMTVQLVDVEYKNGKYAFDFTKLKKFIENGFDVGFTKLEFSHLFTQWGGLYCPKIVAKTEQGEKKIFGWETESEGEEYTAFLNAFLPELISFLKKEGWEKVCYFHLTDEPQEKDLEKYASLRKTVKGLIGDLPVIDALSNVGFKDLVDIPVVDVSCIKHFVGKCDRFGGYYFCGTSKNATNRFIVHPALRTRVVGYQSYLHKLEGFLHWGFNFWKTELSRKNIDPFFVNDAGGAFPAGDAFSVYPVEGGLLESIRLEMVSDGWQEYREVKFIEGKVGREKIEEIFDRYALWNINEYPLKEADYMQMRKEILDLYFKAE